MRFRILAVAAFGTVLTACGPGTVPVNYAPSSVMSIKGATSVGNFRYIPGETGKVDPNQIRNTAMGSIKLDKNIDVFIHDAVFSELRFVGVQVDSPASMLTGEINDFLIDDLGYSIDWTLKIHYVVNKNGKVVYDREAVTQRNTAKFVNVFGALNETIKLNVEELMKDPNFVKAIN